MAKYSVATTRNNLSGLIDKALAGEEVVITRHGKPTVALRVVLSDTQVAKADKVDWDEKLSTLRASQPYYDGDTVKEMRAEYRY